MKANENYSNELHSTHRDQEFEAERFKSPLTPKCSRKLSNVSASPDIKREDVYFQCVSLAFNHVSNNDCGLNICDAFDLADQIYKEFIRRL